jgi:hypothetical protein
MTRFRIFLVSGLVALAGLVVAAPSASAQAQAQAHGSCAGVLSSAAASVQGDEFFRQDFAPLPGATVSGIAGQKGDLVFCASLLGVTLPPGP